MAGNSLQFKKILSSGFHLRHLVVVEFAGKTKRLEESGLANQFLPPFRLTGYFQTSPFPDICAYF